MDFSFCPVLDEMLRTQRTVGQSGKVFDELGALSSMNNLCVLRRLMLERKPSRTLEVGLAYGGSALLITATHRELGHAPGRQHTAIDPFQQEWDNAALAALERAGLIDFVDFRSELSAIAMGGLSAEGAHYGLVYVDGGHFFEDVLFDAYFGLRMLDKGGVILFDDCVVDHVSRVMRFITANWSAWTTEIDLAPYREDGGSLRYRAARAIGKVQLRGFTRTGVDTRAWDARLKNF